MSVQASPSDSPPLERRAQLDDRTAPEQPTQPDSLRAMTDMSELALEVLLEVCRWVR